MTSLKKVKSGDSQEIPAATFNTFIDAARDFRSRQQGRAQTAQQSFRSSGIILIKNVSGETADTEEWDVDNQEAGYGGVEFKVLRLYWSGNPD